MDDTKKLHTLATAMMRKKSMVFLLWLLSKKEMHGYEIIKMLPHENAVQQNVTPAFLYPVLNAMQKQGLISCRKVKDGKRVKKLYKTTAKGLQQIKIVKEKFFKSGLMKEFIEDMMA
ncbi:MAG: PadR family transcriptional regulator [Candidatus Micrarchaeota archaeon]